MSMCYVYCHPTRKFVAGFARQFQGRHVTLHSHNVGVDCLFIEQA